MKSQTTLYDCQFLATKFLSISSGLLNWFSDANHWLALGTLGLAIFAFYQVLIMRDTAKRQLRAYVGVDALSLEIHKTLYKGDRIFQNFLVITVKNFGATLAKEVRVVGYYYISNFAERLPKDFDFSQSNDVTTSEVTHVTLSNFILFPMQKEISKVAIIDREILELFHAAKEKTRTVHLFGRIYYKDIYNRSWRTKFYHVWEPWHPPGERFVPGDEHNGEDEVSWESQLP